MNELKMLHILMTIGISFIFLIEICQCDRRLNRHKRFIEIADDVLGPYCETKPGGPCCPGRDDYCTVPILDSYCYCDMFCNVSSGDCCPDFQRVCLGGIPEPIKRGCVLNGVEYKIGAVFKYNCNTCRCTQNALSPNQADLRCTENVCLVQEDMIQLINDGNYGWKAGNVSSLWGKTLKEGIRYKLGTMPPSPAVLDMNPILMDGYDVLPESFDSRQKWPDYIHPVRDQGDCAASWAFSTAAVASDRLAIESEGVLPDELSPQHLLSCNIRGQFGCEGGSLDKAWWFLRKTGIVSETCYPYVSGFTSKAGECKIEKSKNYRNVTCPNEKGNTLEKILHSTPPYRIRSSEREIMMEIMKNGPVQAILKVKEDFFMYKSGVYSYSRIQPDNMADDDKGYHSIRIIGWGVDRPSRGVELKYWLGVNSWGTDWGERGYVKIGRGTDECKIESCIVSSWGSISSGMMVETICANSWSTEWGENGYFRIKRMDSDTKVESFVLAVWGNVWRLKAYSVREIQKLVAAKRRIRLMNEYQNDGGSVRHYKTKLKRYREITKNEDLVKSKILI